MRDDLAQRLQIKKLKRALFFQLFRLMPHIKLRARVIDIDLHTCKAVTERVIKRMLVLIVIVRVRVW